MRPTLLAALLLLFVGPAEAQVGVSLAHFNQKGSGTIPGAITIFSLSATTISGQGGGYMMIFRGAVPPDGPVDPMLCFYIDAGPTTSSLSMGGNPGTTPTGLSWAYSIGANCQTKQVSSINYVSVAYR